MSRHAEPSTTPLQLRQVVHPERTDSRTCGAHPEPTYVARSAARIQSASSGVSGRSGGTLGAYFRAVMASPRSVVNSPSFSKTATSTFSAHAVLFRFPLVLGVVPRAGPPNTVSRTVK